MSEITGKDVSVTVAPGRTLSHGTMIAPQVTVPDDDGGFRVLSPAVVQERLYSAGEALTLPHEEAAHLVASGFAVFPEAASSFRFGEGPRLRDDPTAIEPMKVAAQ